MAPKKEKEMADVLDTSMSELTPGDLKRVLPKFIENRLNFMLVGPPGVGKTDVVTQVCESIGHKVMFFHPVVSDPTDFKGLPAVVPGGRGGEPHAEFLPFGDLRRLVEAKEPTVAFFDDLGQAPAAVQAAAMQLLLSGRIGEHVVSPMVKAMCAATNRKQDRAGVSGILEPVKSRFPSIFHMRVDHSDWVMWAARSGMPHELIGYIQFRPLMLHDFQPLAEIVNTPCPRTVANVGKIYNTGLRGHDLIAAVAGAAGKLFAVDFMAYLEVYSRIQNLDEVLRDPKKYRHPEESALAWATINALCFKTMAGGAIKTDAEQNDFVRKLNACCTVLDRLNNGEIAVAGMKLLSSYGSERRAEDSPMFTKLINKHIPDIAGSPSF